jgi:hypothetical protein
MQANTSPYQGPDAESIGVEFRFGNLYSQKLISNKFPKQTGREKEILGLGDYDEDNTRRFGTNPNN